MRALTYNIDYNIRLVEASDFDIKDFEFLKGMVSGLYAGNYDITHMFIDSLCTTSFPATAAPRSRSSWTGWMPSREKNNIKFTVTICR